jgi:predicted nucleotidyltransferase
MLTQRLGTNLVEVRLFGSAARGDMWSERSDFRSDIDLLVLTREPLPPDLMEELINETYPLYLECGRQIGAQWRTLEQWASPNDERAREFIARVEEDGQTLFRAA